MICRSCPRPSSLGNRLGLCVLCKRYYDRGLKMKRTLRRVRLAIDKLARLG